MPNLDKDKKKLCTGCNQRFSLKEYDKHMMDIVKNLRGY